jgi:hypothetical protein
MHAIDPLGRLRLLERRLQSVSDLQFHEELAAIFRGLRDLHTAYQLPDSYRGKVAALGFLVERYCEKQDTHFVITKAEPGTGLSPGTEIVAWNGIPMWRVVELNAERQAGSNPAARLARGLEALTLRPLQSSPPPDEQWVVLGLADGTEVRLPWRVLGAHRQGGAAQDPTGSIASALGIDAGNEATRQLKRMLFAPPYAAEAEAHALASVMTAATVTVAGREIGHLRLFSFNVSGARRFLEQLSAVLAELPQDGLIVDIRANPGGLIPAAEGALQLLTDRPVVPVGFSLTATPLALSICRTNPALARWAGSLDSAPETGEEYSRAFPLSDPLALADGLPRYPGPSVLITDALCYSAADIFAAGYQDNEIGEIIGIDSHTGAGGANVWTHELLRMWLPDDLDPLPAGTGFRVAFRRVTRGGLNAGVPLEDLGVAADPPVHLPTLDDLLYGNRDLLAAAAARLPVA